MSAENITISNEHPQTLQSHRRNGQRSDVPTEMPKPLVRFFQGEPEALGTTQIFVGIFILLFGIILTDEHHYRRLVMPVIHTGVTYWSGLMYIVSGSLSVAASIKPTLGKVKSNLILNIISSIAAGAAFIILLIILIVFPRHGYEYDFCAYYLPTLSPNQNVTCEAQFSEGAMMEGFVSIIFLLTILMFCITISTSVFGCRTVCRTSYSEINIILYQTNVVNSPDTETASVAINPLPSILG